MAILYKAARQITGLSSDTKPTINTVLGSTYLETDTFKMFHWDGAAWMQHETMAQTFTNKSIDAESDTIMNQQLRSVFAAGAKRSGAIVIACTAGDSLRGCLKGLTTNGDGTPTWSIDVDEGPVLAFSRAASGIMGYTSTSTSDSITTRRALNPFFKIRFKFNSITTTRLYIGFTSATSLPNTDTPLATGDSGVLFGYRTTDSNFSVINNDGGGAAIVNSTGVAKDTTYHTISFTFGASNVVVVLDDGAGAKTTTLTTRIPATSTDIKLSTIAAY